MPSFTRLVRKVSRLHVNDEYSDTFKLVLDPIGPELTPSDHEELKYQRRKLSSLRRKATDESQSDLQLAITKGWIPLAKHCLIFEQDGTRARTPYLAAALATVTATPDLRDRDRQTLIDLILKDVHYVAASRAAKEEIVQHALPGALNQTSSVCLRHLLQAATRDQLALHINKRKLRQRIQTAVESSSTADIEVFVRAFALEHGPAVLEELAAQLPAHELSNTYHRRREIDQFDRTRRPTPKDRNRDAGRKIMINNILTRLKPFVIAGVDVNTVRWQHSGGQNSHPIFLVCTPDGNPGLPVFLNHGVSMYGREGLPDHSWEWSALDYCAWSGYARNLGLLLKKGMPVITAPTATHTLSQHQHRQQSNSRGWTPLHWLIEGWPTTTMTMMTMTTTTSTPNDSNKNSNGSSGSGPDDWEYKNCLILLINHGHDINVTLPLWDYDGKEFCDVTAYTMARMKGLMALAQLLVRLGANPAL